MSIPPVTLVPLSRLKPAPWNPREINSERFKNLCASIQADPDLLKLRPILATQAGVIYGGNQRYRAAQALGWTDVPAVLSDIPEQLAKERALRDNGSWGAWVEDDLSGLLAELKDAGSDIDLLGFDSPELDRLLAGVTQVPEENEADLEPPADPLTKPGDLWLLGGEHRLLCGDSTQIAALERLLDGERPALLLTDPPYNVGFEYGDGTNDTRADYPAWTADWFNLAMSLSEHAVITIGSVNLAMWLALTEPVHVGVWVKGAAATAHSKVTQFVGWEPVMFYGASRWTRARHMDVFDFEAGAVPKLDHPCPKPVALWSDFLLNFAERGDLVLDVFGGTGTTVIAAEQHGRRARIVEISPAYCDVIRNRWEKLTGKTAVLAD